MTNDLMRRFRKRLYRFSAPLRQGSRLAEPEGSEQMCQGKVKEKKSCRKGKNRYFSAVV